MASFPIPDPCFLQVDKAGATLYVEDPEQRSSTIGVVVNPVRIDSLTEFASLDEVALKLIATERKKVTHISVDKERKKERGKEINK